MPERLRNGSCSKRTAFAQSLAFRPITGRWHFHLKGSSLARKRQLEESQTTKSSMCRVFIRPVGRDSPALWWPNWKRGLEAVWLTNVWCITKALATQTWLAMLAKLVFYEGSALILFFGAGNTRGSRFPPTLFERTHASRSYYLLNLKLPPQA